jgi:formate-dependent nitrite reductase cytochrome c552 subunit
MPTRDPEKRRKHWRDHYERNKDLYYQRNLARRMKCREMIQEAKSVPCADCGESYPHYVMDFDHRDPALKEGTIAVMANQGKIRRLAEEMVKCEVVCSNCHRERTYGHLRSPS